MSKLDLDKVNFKYKTLIPIQKKPYCKECDLPLIGSRTGSGFAEQRRVSYDCAGCNNQYILDEFYPTIVYQQALEE